MWALEIYYARWNEWMYKGLYTANAMGQSEALIQRVN